jgi:hypothetical protein
MVPSLWFYFLLATSYTAFAHCLAAPADFIDTKGYVGNPARGKEGSKVICELDPGVEGFSDYVDVGETQQ